MLNIMPFAYYNYYCIILVEIITAVSESEVDFLVLGYFGHLRLGKCVGSLSKKMGDWPVFGFFSWVKYCTVQWMGGRPKAQCAVRVHSE